ncbi:MFS transporter [Dactylosporangium aurantiacum]|uniref:MFS transporter n=1 Tax=Dactylosporangium aurantiacum TaxID=35754 RepID=UPI001FDFA196|nr:MFS transporter [Dactylosporangium aurantiacum]MDG6101737.1 MFS transporter [Dactylosporangium aurantiacum]
MRRTYLALVLLHTLAVTCIWAINSLLLFEAGLSNTEALLANACFTLGYAVFEIPTGSVADTWGRRVSYLLGSGTLTVTTLLYWLAWRLHADVWAWAAVSLALAAGFTFFSGATEAWLVDALHHLRDDAPLERVFARGQVVAGVGSLAGSLGGAYVAQATDVGVPFLIRAGLLLALTAVAWRVMHDVGFTPRRTGGPVREVRRVLAASVRHGWGRPAVRWMMLGAAVAAGVGYYVAFTMKPYLLQLAGDRRAYGLLGVAAALNAAAQTAGGALAMTFRSLFRRRMSVVIAGVVLNGTLLAGLGMAGLGLAGFRPAGSVPVAMALLAASSLVSAAVLPSRQAYLNSLVPSGQRATVLSFDSLVSSAGAVVTQPGLGRAADLCGYPASYVAGGALQVLALPVLLLARRHERVAAAAPAEPVTAWAPRS